MRVPLAWLRSYVDLPAGETGRAVADRLIRAGLEVETVDVLGADLTGPLLVGRVSEVEEFTASNGKTIRYCQVDVGPAHAGPDGRARGIICGARNFAAGDLVVVALPGAVLPGGFEITARRTYGHVSDGMICSVRELGIGDEHTGILVLPAGPEPGPRPGDDAVQVLGLRDEVLDIAVTPDRGYALSVRGVAREVATAYGTAFRDPADPADRAGDAGGTAAGAGDAGGTTAYPARIEDPTACDRFVLASVTGFDPSAATPLWLRQRLRAGGLRPVSLAVDVTNYVMLELGQPLHAFDRKKLAGPIAVRRARPGERLETLDHVVRDLHPEDILITDDSGPISMAGTMGGLHTEIDEASSELVVEAAHFSAVGIARESRRHKLSSEASRRFERGVDPELPPRAAARAVALLVELGGGAPGGTSEVDLPRQPAVLTVPVEHASRVAGVPYPPRTVIERLRQVGCEVTGEDLLTVTAPTWRPDLTDPNDLAEEVIRLEGYENLPSRLPKAPPAIGYTPEQRLRRRAGMALAGVGHVEVHSYPFVGDAAWDALGIDPEDDRRRTVRLLNPLSEQEPALRTTLLPGLLGALRRNVGRGFSDLALFEIGSVFYPREGAGVAPRPGVAGPPSEAELAALDAALPRQPRYVAAVLAGNREPAGWWGGPRPASWADAIEAARTVAGAAGVELRVLRGRMAPWHPGRCAALAVGEQVVGFAGELHPRALAALGLPPRTSAMELDLDYLAEAGGGIVAAPRVSTYPVATQDVALVVDVAVPAAEVEEGLRAGAGDLLESLRLFDVYQGEQVGTGKRSLAYTLRFRAPDRTLTADEVTAARDRAVAAAARRTGAVLRGA